MTKENVKTEQKKEPPNVFAEYDRLNKLYKAEKNPAKKKELHSKCLLALEAKRKTCRYR